MHAPHMIKVNMRSTCLEAYELHNQQSRCRVHTLGLALRKSAWTLVFIKMSSCNMLAINMCQRKWHEFVLWFGDAFCYSHGSIKYRSSLQNYSTNDKMHVEQNVDEANIILRYQKRLESLRKRNGRLRAKNCGRRIEIVKFSHHTS